MLNNLFRLYLFKKCSKSSAWIIGDPFQKFGDLKRVATPGLKIRVKRLILAFPTVILILNLNRIKNVLGFLDGLGCWTWSDPWRLFHPDHPDPGGGDWQERRLASHRSLRWRSALTGEFSLGVVNKWQQSMSDDSTLLSLFYCVQLSRNIVTKQMTTLPEALLKLIDDR